MNETTVYTHSCGICDREYVASWLDVACGEDVCEDCERGSCELSQFPDEGDLPDPPPCPVCRVRWQERDGVCLPCLRHRAGVGA